eukprot:6693734-Pyramimonas_sp.AAC.1
MSKRGRIVIETGCSGTDGPVMALQMLLDGSFNINHISSAETDRDARLFLLRNGNPQHLFRDVEAH